MILLFSKIILVKEFLYFIAHTMSETEYKNLDNKIDRELEYANGVPLNPISQYNYFVHVYNQPCNLVEGSTLEFAKNDVLFTKLYYFSTPNSYAVRYIIPVLLSISLFAASYKNGSIVCVYLGVVIFIFNLLLPIFVGIRMNNAYKVFLKNSELVSQPLQHMVFNPQFCRQYKQDAVTVNILAKDLESLRLTPLQKEELKQRIQNNRLQFTVYNKQFEKYSQVMDLPFGRSIIFDFIVNFVSSLMVLSLILLNYIYY